MKLRLGIDIDSVLARTEDGWAAYFESNHSTHEHGIVDYKKRADTLDYWGGICKKCFSEVLRSREVNYKLAPTMHSLEAVIKLADRFELHIVTSRHPDVHQPTIAWLERHGFYKRVASVNFSDKKSEVCNKLRLDYHVDDSPRVIEDVLDTPTVILIMNKPYNQDVSCSSWGARFNSWYDIEEFLLAARIVRRTYDREIE